MPHIHVLDQVTIDKIAAGEVIERPASIVKELVENAIDAGAASVKVEIKDGGISFIRIMDNGCGIPVDEVRSAFLRHSTSKIQSVEDLAHISSLGFRGEALSSIAAVTRTELITKPQEQELGTKYVIEGGKEVSLEETGAPNGTTFLIRQLFYNVPARRKFLKTPMTEAGHVQDLLTRLSLSHPEIAFQFVSNGQEKLRTSGNGSLKDVIYNVYGRDVAANLLEMEFEKNGLKISGYLGKPVITRGNRNFENFFVNGRYVKSPMISKALEDAYRDFVMQHKFPFAVLHFHISGEEIDVNVHPTKMELRFQKQQEVYNTVYEGVHRTLLEPELIPQADAPEPISVPKTAESPFLLKPKAPAGEYAREERTAYGSSKSEPSEPAPSKQASLKSEPSEPAPSEPASLKSAPGWNRKCGMRTISSGRCGSGFSLIITGPLQQKYRKKTVSSARMYRDRESRTQSVRQRGKNGRSCHQSRSPVIRKSSLCQPGRSGRPALWKRLARRKRLLRRQSRSSSTCSKRIF